MFHSLSKFNSKINVNVCCNLRVNVIKRYLTGGQLAYKKLQEHHVKDVFLYSGGAIMPFVDAFYKGPINYFVNTHEQNLGHEATAYAKTTDKTGVCIVTSGPGLTNMITPMLDATNDSTPLVVFSGQVPLSSMNTNAFQECAATEISSHVTKWSYCVQDVDELSDVIDAAFHIANTGKKGAVHIDLPKCVLSAKYNELDIDYGFTYELEFKDKLASNINDESVYNIDFKQSVKTNTNRFITNYISSNNYDNTEINSKTLRQIADVINNSKKPVLYVGQGCNDSSALLREFAIKANIPVTTTIHAMGVFDEEHPLALEFLGMHGNAAANYSIQNSDCIIAIGSRFDDRTIGNVEYYAPEARSAGHIIHVNLNSKEINSVVKSDYNVVADSGEFLSQIMPLIDYKSRNAWTKIYSTWKSTIPFQYKKDIAKIKTQDVISEINKQVLDKNISEDVIITSGVGNHQMMAAQFIKWKHPKTFISSGSLGVMGVGLPYAIGAKIANKDKIVIDIDGDGSFNHTLSDLKTVATYDLPIKIAIMNDGEQSMVKVWEDLFFEGRFTATKLDKNPDYKALAESFGIKAIACDSHDDLESDVNYFLDYKGPILCDFKVLTDKCFPLVAPGRALDDLILHSDSDDDSNNYHKYDFSNELPPS